MSYKSPIQTSEQEAMFMGYWQELVDKLDPIKPYGAYQKIKGYAEMADHLDAASINIGLIMQTFTTAQEFSEKKKNIDPAAITQNKQELARILDALAKTPARAEELFAALKEIYRHAETEFEEKLLALDPLQGLAPNDPKTREAYDAALVYSNAVSSVINFNLDTAKVDTLHMCKRLSERVQGRSAV